MVIEPVLGLFKHVFELEHLHLEWMVAGLIVAGTVLYVSRIVGISFSYGLGGKRAPQLEMIDIKDSDKPYDGPFLAG